MANASLRQLTEYLSTLPVIGGEESNLNAVNDTIQTKLDEISTETANETAGVELWNLSARWRSVIPLKTVANMRRVAYNLIEPHSTPVQLLTLRTKVAQAYLDADDFAVAEEMLNKAKSVATTIPPSIDYYLVNARLEIHKKEWIACTHMLSKAKESCKTFKDAQTLAEFYIACSKQPGLDAVRWLREGYDAVNRLKIDGGLELIEDRLLLQLAKTYLERNEFELGKGAIKHMLERDMSLLDPNLLLVELYVQQREKEKAAKHAMVLSTFQFESSESMSRFISTVLRHAGFIGLDTALNAFDMQLARRPDCDELYIAKTKALADSAHNSDANTSIEAIKAIIRQLIQNLGELNADLKNRIRSFVWSAGVSLYDKGRFEDAEKWLICITNLIENDEMDRINASIVFKKIAACQIQLKRFQDASEYLQRSLMQNPRNTQAVGLICVCSVELGKLDHLDRHFRTLLEQSNDNDRDSLINMVIYTAEQKQQQENGSSNSKLYAELLVLLYQALFTVDDEQLKRMEIPRQTLVRCLLRSMRESMPDRHPWNFDLSEYFRTALSCLEKMDAAEIDWIARTAWNLCLDMIEAKEIKLAINYIGFASKFLQHLPPDTDNTTLLRRSFFLSAVTNLETARSLKQEDMQPYLQACQEALGKFKSITELNFTDPLHLLAFQIEWETCLKLGIWSRNQEMVELIERKTEASSTFYERLTDIALKEPQCPPDLLVNMIQATLDRLLKEINDNEPSRLRDQNTNQLSYDRFSEWFRFLVNAAFLVSSQKAWDYYQQILPLINDVKDLYPAIEIEWLMIRAWNTSVEFSSLNCDGEAKQWREVAKRLLGYLPDKARYALTLMANIQSKRLAKEIKQLATTPPPGIELEDCEDITCIKIRITGVEGTLYTGEKFRLQFKFPINYPLESPEVIFLHPAIPIHPHVYSNGHICLSILYDQWSPALTISSVCLSILSMLSSSEKKEPPPDNARYVDSHKGKSPKLTQWWFHDDKA